MGFLRTRDQEPLNSLEADTQALVDAGVLKFLEKRPPRDPADLPKGCEAVVIAVGAQILENLGIKP